MNAEIIDSNFKDSNATIFTHVKMEGRVDSTMSLNFLNIKALKLTKI